MSPTDPESAHRIAKLERINAALMAHVERSMDQQGSAYSLFQTAIMLEGRVRSRTEELTGLMHSLERSNAALVAAKEEAETANRSKTRFLAAASHDLLQPLNAARLSASALADMPLTPDARTISGQIERGLQTIEDLIKTLLDISKLDAGVVRPVIRPVRLSDLLAGIAASFRHTAEGKGLRLHVRGADRVVASDRVMLGRIVQNLVSNALRYTASGGVLIAVRARGDAARIEVIDTGYGIGPAERALVFEEFYRGAAETMDSEPGLGLGLSIVQRMAAALGHPLSLASRLGHGTRVSLTVPLGTALPEAEARIGPVATCLTGAKILVVENDPATADALARLLRNWDAEVVVVRDLAGARAAGSVPDLLILDYHLDHGACGLAVAEHFRDATGRPLPAIVTTADHGAAIAAEVSALGAELVHKPTRPAELRALLTALLARAAFSSGPAAC